MRRNRCNTKRLNAAGKWIGGRGHPTGGNMNWWATIGTGRYYKNNYHRAMRRVAKDYCRLYNNITTEDAENLAYSDVHEDFKSVEYWHREIVWKGW